MQQICNAVAIPEGVGEIPYLETDGDRAAAFLRGLKQFDTLASDTINQLEIGENARLARANRCNRTAAGLVVRLLVTLARLSHDRS